MYSERSGSVREFRSEESGELYLAARFRGNGTFPLVKLNPVKLSLVKLALVKLGPW
jgi:hypothetical protein